MSPLVAIPCKLYQGMFSSERVFVVPLADGKTYDGVAPRHFCWNSDGEPVGEGERTDGAPGFVAAKVVEELDGNQLAVEVPDGEVVAVDKGVVRQRPTTIHPPTPPAARECEPNVPV
jgi:hypothetical protein